jgi:hypothetical protein
MFWFTTSPPVFNEPNTIHSSGSAMIIVARNSGR